MLDGEVTKNVAEDDAPTGEVQEGDGNQPHGTGHDTPDTANEPETPPGEDDAEPAGAA